MLRGVTLNNSWVKVITLTGSLGVIAFLFSLFMMNVFSDNITNLLGSEKVFYIIVGIFTILAIGIIIALLQYQSKKDSSTSSMPQHTDLLEKIEKKEITVSYNDSSTHNGDNRF